MIKLEKGTIVIKGKKYAFLKPTAVDLIEIEDSCIGKDGSIDTSNYNQKMLGLVSKDLKVDDLIEYIPQTVSLSDGTQLCVPKIDYNKWLNIGMATEGFSRVKMAKHVVASTGVSGEISLDNFSYEDIDSLAKAFYNMYDSSELNRVVDEISTFCFQKTL